MPVLAKFSVEAVFKAGRPLKGAMAWVFEAGTLVAKPVYTDATQSAQHPHPVPMDGYDRFPPMWVGVGDYRIRVTDAGGAILWDIDGLPGDVPPEDEGGSGIDSAALAMTGDIKAKYGSGVEAGWVRCNGRSIGNATSGADERANNDCYQLFAYLWNSDVSLPVSGGRGGSADIDWSSGKTIALPDLRGRVLIGLDGMGSTAAGRLAGGYFASGNATTLGSVCGRSTELLTLDQIPAHAHGVAMAAAGSHNHGGGTGAAGGHGHNASIEAGGSHSHTGTTTANGDHSHTPGAGGSFYATTGTGTALAYGSGTIGPYSQTATNVNGLHSHTFTTSAEGHHGHNIGIEPAADHVHGIWPDGAHTHPLTEYSIGGGQAHNNLQPGMLITYYIKL